MRLEIEIDPDLIKVLLSLNETLKLATGSVVSYQVYDSLIKAQACLSEQLGEVLYNELEISKGNESTNPAEVSRDQKLDE